MKKMISCCKLSLVSQRFGLEFGRKVDTRRYSNISEVYFGIEIFGIYGKCRHITQERDD